MPRRLLPLLLLCACALVAPAGASAQGIVVEGAFGSGTAPDGRFSRASGIATDAAGRVYVADAERGVVELFDSATSRTPNRFLRTIGEGRLKRPTGVAVDNRQRLAVTDSARDVVDLFGSAVEGFALRASFGKPGTARGEFERPVAVAADPTTRLLVLEAGTLRVSIVRPQGRNALRFVTAFGLAAADPPLRHPAAIALDRARRVYVADADPEGGFVRVTDPRGELRTSLRGFNAPSGIAVDRFDRLLVADTGGGRVVARAPVSGGAAELAVVGGLERPAALALAPGALAYVAEPGRIVRMRFDDADVDGVADQGDNCRGVANGQQDDADRDEKGDACDADDDGDGRPDGEDRCPTETPTRPDRNGDGCRDAQARVVSPGATNAPRRSPPRITGRADGGTLGVEQVDVALSRLVRGTDPRSRSSRCEFLIPAERRFAERPCDEPVWFRAGGTTSWRVELPANLLRRGRHGVYARAHQAEGGPVEAELELGRNVRAFRVG